MTLPDIADLASYGGAKQNYAPVEDQLTDEDADHRNQYAADIAGTTHTITRAFCAFIGDASTPTDPVSNVHDAVWGNGLDVKPTVVKTGTGVYTITWLSDVEDELDVERSVNLRRAWHSVEGSTPYFVTTTVTSPNVVTVRVFNSSGVANDGAGVTFCVFAV